MATTKTIEQLDAAAPISATDQMPLAQTSGKEARRVTVEKLAEAAAAVSAAGPFGELSAAVAAGKNLLAQTLTAKGKPSTPQDTLVEMADKLNALTVNDSQDDIKGPYIKTMMNTTSYSTRIGFNYGRIFKHPITGDSIVLLGSKIYYIPAGKYDSFELFIAAATHVYDVSLEDSSYTIERQYNICCVSEDFTKILVQLSSTYVNHVYSITESGITKIKEFTKNLAASNAINGGVSISDDGDYVFYRGSANNCIMYKISADAEYSVNLSMQEGTNAFLKASIIKDSNIYAILGNNYTAGYIIPYMIDSASGTVSFGTPQQTAVTYYQDLSIGTLDLEWIHTPGADDEPILYIANVKSSKNDGAHCVYKLTANVLPMRLGGNLIPIQATQVAGHSNNYFCNIPLNAQNSTVVIQDKAVTFKFPHYKNEITVHLDTNTVSYSKNINNYALWKQADNSPSYLRTICHSDTKLVVSSVSYSTGSPSYMPNAIGQYYDILDVSDTDDSVIFAKILTKNGKVGYLDPVLQLSELESGAYDTATTVVNLPKSEIQEAN